MFDNLFSILNASDFNALLKEYADNDEAYLGYLLINGFKSSEKSKTSKAA